MSPLIIEIVLGVTLLFAGYELLVRGAVAYAQKFNVSVAVINLVIVAYSMCLPVLLVTLQATTNASPDIALGNVIGSVIFNLLFMLGLAATIAPIGPQSFLLKRDGWLMVGACALLTLNCWDEEINIGEGLMMLAALAIYTLYFLRTKKERPQADLPLAYKATDCSLCSIAYMLVGLGLQMTGADLLIDGAVGQAKAWDILEGTIGLTLVAPAASLPIAMNVFRFARAKQAHISAAILINANIFNILAAIGLSVIFIPITIGAQFLNVDLCVLIAVGLLSVLLLSMRRNISRPVGIVLIALYVAYGVYQYAFTAG